MFSFLKLDCSSFCWLALFRFVNAQIKPFLVCFDWFHCCHSGSAVIARALKSKQKQMLTKQRADWLENFKMLKFRVTSPRGQDFEDVWSQAGSTVKLTGQMIRKSIRRSNNVDRPRFLIAEETGRMACRRSSVPNEAFVSLSDSLDSFRYHSLEKFGLFRA